MSELLTIDGLSFVLRRSAERRTVGITIERAGELTLTMPLDCSLDRAQRVVRKRRKWVYGKLAEKESLYRPLPTKEFVNGEGFHYLGRSYRLLLISPAVSTETVPALRLSEGRFLLRREERGHAREHFIGWYVANGRPWLQRRVDLLANRIGVQPGVIEVRDLGFHWGSCNRNGRLNFHWRTILLPPRIIEYVVAHELVHLREFRHNPGFWRRLERVIPDFAERKRWLAENGASFY
jgi:predicted metal-dependent hydrolase